MKFIIVAVFMAIYLAVNVHSASVTHSVSKDKLAVKGTADVSLNIPIEEVWDGLSQVHRYPTINSGDTIALRSAYTSGSYTKYWLACGTSYCFWYTCPGTIIISSRWTSCSKAMIFTIIAKGKTDGEPINSGDTVSLRSNNYGSSYRLYCSSSSSSYCRILSTTSSMTGSAWLRYSYATFEIYSKNAGDGSPVQYGDVVGLKFPYSSNSAWLTQYSNRFYARSCSSNSKTSCAKENTWTGFKIFKKLS
ncbi:uncharacterized protein LOC110047924 isoform X1 [Orbicella faveolata]|uniref:uncharacterized protein LOC110047924 isoform X1 n=1 Tax=Orbicella faveolata TaxID=48498 RepID=UPI0009E3272F|nr:uncharacterized protein LOC110047924 isoform X1 [Orbicella faveolata]